MKDLQQYLSEKLIINKNSKINSKCPITGTTWKDITEQQKQRKLDTTGLEYCYVSTNAEDKLNDMFDDIIKNGKPVIAEYPKPSEDVYPLLCVKNKGQYYHKCKWYGIIFKEEDNFISWSIINPTAMDDTVITKYIGKNLMINGMISLIRDGKTYTINNVDVSYIYKMEDYIKNT